jgi:hypothetical protein
MSEHPTTFCFSAALEETNDHPLIYTDNRLVGGNPKNEEGLWDTKEEAFVNFAVQFLEMAHAAHHDYLFVRRAPELVQSNTFDGGTKWRMIGRFSIAKLKEKNT